jgi:glycosyltransferase involved in cell wall biosynthesis
VSRIFGILVTFRRSAHLELTLERLAGQDHPLDGLVLVDNSPNERNRQASDRFAAQGFEVEYVAAPENLGAAGGVALGMESVLRRAADNDWIVVFDDDDPPRTSNVIGDMHRFADEMRLQDDHTGGVGLVGSRFDWKHGRLTRPVDAELVGPVPVDSLGDDHFPFYLVGAIRVVGPYLGSLFMSHELEFGLRLRAAGYSIYANGPLWLANRSADGRLGIQVNPALSIREPTWRRYYNRRNFIYVLRSWDRDALAIRIILVRWVAKPLAGLLFHPRWALQHLSLTWMACRDGWRGRLGRRLEPTVDLETGSYRSQKQEVDELRLP